MDRGKTGRRKKRFLIEIVALQPKAVGLVYQMADEADRNANPMTPLCKAIVGIYRALGRNLPEGEWQLRRTHAGKNEKARGALCWTLYYESRQHLSCCGGWERATDIVKAWRRDHATVEMNGYRDYDVLALETVKPKGSSKRKSSCGNQ